MKNSGESDEDDEVVEVKDCESVAGEDLFARRFPQRNYALKSRVFPLVTVEIEMSDSDSDEEMPSAVRRDEILHETESRSAQSATQDETIVATEQPKVAEAVPHSPPKTSATGFSSRSLEMEVDACDEETDEEKHRPEVDEQQSADDEFEIDNASTETDAIDVDEEAPYGLNGFNDTIDDQEEVMGRPLFSGTSTGSPPKRIRCRTTVVPPILPSPVAESPTGSSRQSTHNDFLKIVDGYEEQGLPIPKGAQDLIYFPDDATFYPLSEEAKKDRNLVPYLKKIGVDVQGYGFKPSKRFSLKIWRGVVKEKLYVRTNSSTTKLDDWMEKDSDKEEEILDQRRLETIENEDIVCDICEYEQELLLCSGCMKGFCLACAVPPLAAFPPVEEDWFCNICKLIPVKREWKIKIKYQHVEKTVCKTGTAFWEAEFLLRLNRHNWLRRLVSSGIGVPVFARKLPTDLWRPAVHDRLEKKVHYLNLGSKYPKKSEIKMRELGQGDKLRRHVVDFYRCVPEEICRSDETWLSMHVFKEFVKIYSRHKLCPMFPCRFVFKDIENEQVIGDRVYARSAKLAANTKFVKRESPSGSFTSAVTTVGNSVLTVGNYVNGVGSLVSSSMERVGISASTSSSSSAAGAVGGMFSTRGGGEGRRTALNLAQISEVESWVVWEDPDMTIDTDVLSWWTGQKRKRVFDGDESSIEDDDGEMAGNLSVTPLPQRQMRAKFSSENSGGRAGREEREGEREVDVFDMLAPVGRAIPIPPPSLPAENIFHPGPQQVPENHGTRVEFLEAENRNLRKRNSDLEAENRRLLSRVAELERIAKRPRPSQDNE